MYLVYRRSYSSWKGKHVFGNVKDAVVSVGVDKEESGVSLLTDKR